MELQETLSAIVRDRSKCVCVHRLLYLLRVQQPRMKLRHVAEYLSELYPKVYDRARQLLVGVRIDWASISKEDFSTGG